MIYVVAYDIEDNRIRNRVAGLLEGYGRRVQESVFECQLEAKDVDELTARLKKELEHHENGQIRMYRVCNLCLQASFGMGQIKAVDTNSCYIV